MKCDLFVGLGRLQDGQAYLNRRLAPSRRVDQGGVVPDRIVQLVHEVAATRQSSARNDSHLTNAVLGVYVDAVGGRPHVAALTAHHHDAEPWLVLFRLAATSLTKAFVCVGGCPERGLLLLTSSLPQANDGSGRTGRKT